jgi:hypothetical protein
MGAREEYRARAKEWLDIVWYVSETLPDFGSDGRLSTEVREGCFEPQNVSPKTLLLSKRTTFLADSAEKAAPVDGKRQAGRKHKYD